MMIATFDNGPSLHLLICYDIKQAKVCVPIKVRCFFLHRIVLAHTQGDVFCSFNIMAVMKLLHALVLFALIWVTIQQETTTLSADDTNVAQPSIITNQSGNLAENSTVENEHPASADDDDGEEDEEDEDQDYDSGESSTAKATNAENVEEEDDDYYNSKADQDEEDDDEEYEEPSCTVKLLLENMNLTAMLPQDGDRLRQEYDEYMLSDDPLQIRTAPTANHTFQRLNRLVNWFRDVADQQQVRAGLTNFLHQNFDVLLTLELDSICINSIVAILVAIRRNEPWALKFVDSAPKIPSGLMNGVSSFLGSFDECLSIESPSTLSESYTGQYCTVKPLLPLPATEMVNHYDRSDPQVERLLRFYAAYNVQHYFQMNPALKFVELMKSKKGRVTNFGLCLPSTCDGRQLEIALNKCKSFLGNFLALCFLVEMILIWQIKQSSLSNHRHPVGSTGILMLDPKQSQQFLASYGWLCSIRNASISYCCCLCLMIDIGRLIIAVLVVLVGAATLYDIYPWLVRNFQHRNGNDERDRPVAVETIVEIFSAVSNTGRLFDQSPNRLAVLDTLRLIIIFVIGLCNAFYLTPLTSLLHNIAGSVPGELFTSRKYFLIRAPILLNDGLLIIAGALFVRSIFRHLVQPHDLFTYLVYFVRRWIRLTMPLFGSIMFLYLLPSAGYGPLWSRVGEILLPACKSPSSIASSLFHFSNWNFVRANYTNDDCYLVVGLLIIHFPLDSIN